MDAKLISVDKLRVLGLIVLIIVFVSTLSLQFIVPQINIVVDLYRGLPHSIMAAQHPIDVVKVKGLKGEVKITWDEWGVPHIYAYTEEDLFYALGYVMAVDRLWQMDLLRRAAEGNLSAWFGEEFVEEDEFMRKLGIIEHSKQTYTYLKSIDEGYHVAELLDAFTLGVNARIEEVLENNLLPPEYLLLGVRPEKWRPWDSIAIGYLMAYMLSFNTNDLKLKEFLEANGYEALIELDILNRSLNTPIVSSRSLTSIELKTVNSTYKVEYPWNTSFSSTFNRIDNIHEILRSITGFYTASNSWVIHGDLTETGYPILANDPHLQLSLPPIWYLAQIALHDDSYNVFAAFIPGIPFPIIGRNHYVSWGFTNAPVDVVDYYYYVWRGDEYYYKGVWLKPTIRYENLTVRMKNGEYKTITVKVEETVHGPIIDDEKKIAVQWTGLMVNTGFIAFYKASKAKSVHEVLEAFNNYYITPPQNMVVADRINIVYLLVGSIPIRSGNYVNVSGKLILNRGFLPFNGSNGEGEWHKWIAPEEKPQLFNPEKSIIVTANNKPIDTSSYPYYLGWHWLDRYRYERIVEYLEDLVSRSKIKVGDNMNLQHDVKAKDAEILLPLMIRIAEQKPINDPEVLEALRLLKNWDYVMSADKVEPALYTLWLMNLHKRLWNDELAKAGISDETFLTLEFTELVLRREIEEHGSMSKWVDGDISIILIEALREAIDYLRQYSEDWEKVTWGTIHYYSIEHPLGSYLPPLNYKPIPAPGGFYTVNVAPWLKVTVGPSLRVIFDMSSDKSVAIIPGGESGVPFSKYYDNLVEPWYSGVYLVLWLPTEYGGKGEKLILRPG